MKPDAFSCLSIFKDLTDAERAEIMALAEPVEVAKGEQIITQGKQVPNLWFIVEGKCQVTRRTESGCQLNLTELEAYTHFGEMSFFHDAPHSADVIALTDMKLLRLSRTAFNKLCASGSPVALKLTLNCIQQLANRLRSTDQWITELVCKENHQPTPSEWTNFRELIFKGA
jgi:CRP/FNR family transcriptional regulator, cyclic AMP receptor protein